MMTLKINSEDFLDLDSKMIMHASIAGLLQPSSLTYNSYNQACILFEPPDDCISLARGIKETIIHLDMILQLIESLISLKKHLDLHLLSIECIQLSPNCVFYNPNKKAFLFIYAPSSQSREEEHLAFFRALTLEANDLHTKHFIKLFKLLKSRNFTIEGLYDQLRKNKPLQKKKRNIIGPFFKKNAPRMPCLIDKESPHELHSIILNITLVGSSEICNIHIKSKASPCEYARILKTDEGYCLEPLMGDTRIALNNRPIEEKALLKNGDLLAFDHKEFIFIP